MMEIMFYFFFFFQAEDGIRDKLVTGVQTCALPIYRRHEEDGQPEEVGKLRQQDDDQDRHQEDAEERQRMRKVPDFDSNRLGRGNRPWAIEERRRSVGSGQRHQRVSFVSATSEYMHP